MLSTCGFLHVNPTLKAQLRILVRNLDDVIKGLIYDVIVTSSGLYGAKNANFGHLNCHKIVKNAPIKLKIGRKVARIVFFKNQLHNGDLHCQMDPRRARNVHFLVKKWCSKIEPF